jgi:hypothetical protein
MMQTPDHIPDVRKMVPEQTLTTPDTRAQDFARIWLEPALPGDINGERLWCKDDVWTGDPDYDGALPTEYVRADLAVDARLALAFRAGAEAMRDAAAAAFRCDCDWRPTGAGCYCPLARDKIAAQIRALPLPEMPA